MCHADLDYAHLLEPPPNPGSFDAKLIGCVCPAAPNNHGEQPPEEPNGWWIAPACPVHGPSVRELAGVIFEGTPVVLTEARPAQGRADGWETA